MAQDDYNVLLLEAFGASSVPGASLISSPELTALHLSDEKMADLNMALLLMGHLNPQLELICIFPVAAALFSLYYDPWDVYGMMEAFLKHGSVINAQSHAGVHGKEWPFYPNNRRELLVFGRIFEDLIEKHVPKVARHILKLQHLAADASTVGVPWGRLLSGLFVGILPLSFVLKIFDSYLVEGFKIIIKYGLAHILLLQERLIETFTFEDFANVIFKSFDAHGIGDADMPFNFKTMQKTAFSFKFSRNLLIRFKNRHRKHSLEDFETADKAILLQKPLPKLNRPSTIVTDLEWLKIWGWVPSRHRISNLEVVFASTDHGHRLTALFEAASDSEPLLLVVETTDGNVFGAYLSKSLKNRTCRKFFGTGETFIFNLRPQIVVYPWQESSNNYHFIFADQNFLAVGCSGGKFGIWIDRDLNQVVSCACETFNNPPLVDHENGWSEIYSVELYRFK